MWTTVVTVVAAVAQVEVYRQVGAAFVEKRKLVDGVPLLVG